MIKKSECFFDLKKSYFIPFESVNNVMSLYREGEMRANWNIVYKFADIYQIKKRKTIWCKSIIFSLVKVIGGV